MPKLRVFDNTMLQTHEDCRRKYLMRHILDWESELTPPAPGFGICWHSAMDVVWPMLHKEYAEHGTLNFDLMLTTQAGFRAFIESWLEEGYPDPRDPDPQVWERFRFRTPDTAAEMLSEYVVQRQERICLDFEILAVEKPFLVPLDPNDPELFYCGRMDKIIRWRGKIWVVDHKTNSSYKSPGRGKKEGGGFQASFTDSFSPNTQVDGYSYAGHMIWGKDFKGVLIDAALVWSTRHDIFDFIPVEKDPTRYESWLLETREKIDYIERQQAKLKDYENSMALPVFGKNTGACWNYNTPCLYHDICSIEDNPLTLERPDYLFERHWSPFEHAHLEELGLSEAIASR